MLLTSLPVGYILSGAVYHYTILRVLGQGTFGITYLARTEIAGPLGSIPIQIALKEFFAKDFNARGVDGSVREVSSESIARRYGRAFQRESLNLSKMSHPGIVRVLEAFESNGTYYYAMEYLDGESLDVYVQSKGRLREEEAVRYIGEIGRALSYMHDRKMLHLDLKPKNIMLRADGSAVLIDFGLSKQYTENGEPESSTMIGLGTPGYAPLEQANGSFRDGFAATLDIYALGATFYKLLVGHSPADASTVLNEGFPAEDLRAAGVSSHTISVIERSMSPQRKSRPQSVGEFLELLNGNSDTEMKRPENSEETVISDASEMESEETETNSNQTTSPHSAAPKTSWSMHRARKNRIIWIAVGLLSFLLGALFIPLGPGEWSAPEEPVVMLPDSTSDLGQGWRKIRNGDKIVYTNGDVSFTMIRITGGTLKRSGKQPKTLNDFLIGETEVTQAVWLAVMGDYSTTMSLDDLQRPANGVSYNDCLVFIERLNALTGEHFRLPTEAEWTFAAHGGNHSRGYQYSGSNRIGEVAWYRGNSGGTTLWGRLLGERYPHRVKTKKPNELGLYDMSGNVEEWCEEEDELVTLLGGAYDRNKYDCRVDTRFYIQAADNRPIWTSKAGLRLALAVEDTSKVVEKSTTKASVPTVQPPDQNRKEQTKPIQEVQINEKKESTVLSKNEENDIPIRDGHVKSTIQEVQAIEKKDSNKESVVISKDEEDDTPMVIAETMPMFMGGAVDDFARWCEKHVVYPQAAQNRGLQGRVIVQFVVERDGSISHVKVLQGKHKKLNDEAVRVIKSAPKWTPGTNRGKPVRIYVNVPIDFVLCD